jgi:hypothetical protein
MNKRSRAYLLEYSATMPTQPDALYYDDCRSINYVSAGERMLPAAACQQPPTHSKTAAAPGDDDPDPDNEQCY